MRISDLPNDVQKDLEKRGFTIQYFYVTDYTEQRQGVMCDIGGVEQFGDDWEAIVAGKHPAIECVPVEIVLH